MTNMRGHVSLKDWKGYNPMTNILLHFFPRESQEELLVQAILVRCLELLQLD